MTDDTCEDDNVVEALTEEVADLELREHEDADLEEAGNLFAIGRGLVSRIFEPGVTASMRTSPSLTR